MKNHNRDESQRASSVQSAGSDQSANPDIIIVNGTTPGNDENVSDTNASASDENENVSDTNTSAFEEKMRTSDNNANDFDKNESVFDENENASDINESALDKPVYNVKKVFPKKRTHKIKTLLIGLMSVVLICTITLSVFVWKMLSKTNQTIIPIVTGGGVSEGFLDGMADIDDDNTNSSATNNAGGAAVIEKWGNGRVKVYVDPNFPITMVPQKDPNVENILIIGLDSRTASDRQARTDSIILVSVDKTNKAIKLTSFMRDTQVKIPGRTAPNKINAAYAFGGIGLLINTMNLNFDLDIQKFAMVDFLSAENIINAAGGVTINVTKGEVVEINANMEFTNTIFTKFSTPSENLTKSGSQLLDGRQAVSYGRIRHIGNDQGRTLRQRTVLSALIVSFKAAPVSRKMAVFDTVFQSFETSLSKSEMVFFAFDALSAIKNIQQYRVPEDGMYTTNKSNYQLVTDFDKQNPALYNFIWGNTGNNSTSLPDEIPDPTTEPTTISDSSLESGDWDSSSTSIPDSSSDSSSSSNSTSDISGSLSGSSKSSSSSSGLN